MYTKLQLLIGGRKISAEERDGEHAKDRRHVGSRVFDHSQTFRGNTRDRD
jgi:hypothetical protein